MPTPTPADQQSPFKLMSDIELRLRILFSSLAVARTTDFPARILNICTDLQHLCETDADAALGILVLGTEVRYTITHPLHVAMLCDLVRLRAWGELWLAHNACGLDSPKSLGTQHERAFDRDRAAFRRM